MTVTASTAHTVSLFQRDTDGALTATFVAAVDNDHVRVQITKPVGGGASIELDRSQIVGLLDELPSLLEWIDIARPALVSVD